MGLYVTAFYVKYNPLPNDRINEFHNKDFSYISKAVTKAAKLVKHIYLKSIKIEYSYNLY